MSAKKQLHTALAKIDKNITTTLHSQLSTIHSNDAALTKQTKALQSRTQEARKQQDTWNSLVRAGRNGLKVAQIVTLSELTTGTR
jgi:GCN5-like protein 1 (GCN5L1)